MSTMSGSITSGSAGKVSAAARLAVCLLLVGVVSPVFASPETMRGPDAKRSRVEQVRDPETSVPSIVFLGAISAFQKYVSPTDGDRCGFSPSCSAFGRAAVAEQGPVLGVIVTADRLMRCTTFKRPGPDYMPLPDGKLFDPVENNMLSFP